MAYLAKGFGKVKFSPERLERGLQLDKIFFQNINKIELIFPKYHRNMRWLAHYYLPVIRYWNPNMQFYINHRAFEQEAQIILHKQQSDAPEILKPLHFIHDQLFEQIIEIEKGANATLLQQTLMQNVANHDTSQTSQTSQTSEKTV